MAKNYKMRIHEAVDNALEDYPNAKVSDAIWVLEALVSELKRTRRRDKAEKISDRTRYRLVA